MGETLEHPLKKLIPIFFVLWTFPFTGEALTLSPGHTSRETVSTSSWAPPLPPATRTSPRWLRQYPGSGSAASAEYLHQERSIARKETIREKEYEITSAAKIPNNPRSRAILAHLHALSRRLDAAAKARASGIKNPARRGVVP